MKLNRRQILAGSAAMGVGLSLVPSTAFAQTKVLRFSTYLPTQHPMVTNFFNPFIEEVKQATNGEVSIEFTASSLAPPPRQFEMVSDGLANVGFTTHSYTPGRFPLTGMAELPFLGEKSVALSQAYWEVYNEHFASAGEHAGFKVLAMSTTGPGALWTNVGPITSLEDLQGLKIVVPGGLGADIGEALGVVTVEAPAPQWYEILSRGTADGAMFSIDAPMKFNLEQFLPHYARVPGGLFNNSFAFYIGQRDWDALGPDLQAKIEPLLGADLSRKMGVVWDAGDTQAISRFGDQGITQTDVSGDFLATIEETVAPVEAEWIETANAQGVDGAAALAAFRARTAELIAAA